MKKSSVDDTYIVDATYPWAADGAIVDIESEDYNVYLQGTSNSGSSPVYTIAGVNNILAIPVVDVLFNEKIYEVGINYTSMYTVPINY